MDKKAVLEISKFGGIDRFDRGTNTPHNLFEEMVNMHPVSIGELASIKGPTDITDQDLPGCEKIIHTAIHKDFSGRELLMAFFKTDITRNTDFGESLIDASCFSATEGSSQTTYYQVVLYGPGGTYRTKWIDGVTINSGGWFTKFTTPAGIPNYVCQINIYHQDTSLVDGVSGAAGALVASLHRREGVFPATVEWDQPQKSTTTGITNQINPHYACIINNFSNGELTPGKVHYAAICPAISQGPYDSLVVQYPRARYFTRRAENSSSSTFIQEPIAFITPDETKSVNFSFFYPNSTSDVTGSSDYYLNSAGVEVRQIWAFLGTTPEDLLLCSQGIGMIEPNPGAYIPLNRRDNSQSMTGKTFNANGSMTSINFFLLKDLSPIRYFKASGTDMAGIVHGRVYWVKHVTETTIFLCDSLENAQNGIYINVGAPGTAANHYFCQVQFSARYDHLPYNSNNGVTTISQGSINAPRQFNGTNQQGDPDRLDGAFMNASFYPLIQSVDGIGSLGISTYKEGYDFLHYPLAGDAENLGCWVLPEKVFNDKAYQLLANIGEKNFALKFQKDIGGDFTSLTRSSIALSPDISPSLLWIPQDDIISTTQFTLRTYVANGEQTIFQTNGYVLKPMIRSNGRVRVPTSKYLSAFATRLVCGGGEESWQNSQNQVYYCEPDLPFDWGTSTPNTINVFTQQGINGFGAYSQNLSTSGFAQYLLISKKDGLFSWDGNPASGPQQLYYGFGMAGPQAFVETDFGPVVISRENIYMLKGGTLQEVGDNVSDILKRMTDEQLDKIVAVYHEKKCKIMYQHEDLSIREIWMDMRIEKGQMMTIFSGPHQMMDYNHQCSSIIFNDDRDVRFYATDTRLFQADAIHSINAADMLRKLVISRLSMGQDYLWKVLTDIYIATLVEADSTFTIRLDFEDGTPAYNGSLPSTLARTRQLCQHLIRSRPRGRIVKLTIEQGSSAPISIFNIGMLFEIQKRRLLRYT